MSRSSVGERTGCDRRDPPNFPFSNQEGESLPLIKGDYSLFHLSKDLYIIAIFRILVKYFFLYLNTGIGQKIKKITKRIQHSQWTRKDKAQYFFTLEAVVLNGRC